MNYLVTGVAGFIGSKVAARLLGLGHEVAGVDCFTDYYPKTLKETNLAPLRDQAAFRFIEADLVEMDLVKALEKVDVVIHLAAQAGVRRSWASNFKTYTRNNILSTQGLLEAGHTVGLSKMVHAGSSSVYGDTSDLPMRETSACWPVSPYGVTKLAAEHLCLLYHRNFGLDTTSLRYFTVYGPGQRPDMAFHRFIRAMYTGGEIRLFGDGEQSRDFTYVEDIVSATLAAAQAEGAAGQVFNIGGGSRVSVNRVLEMLAEITGEKARITRLAVAKGDVRDTWADCSKAGRILGFSPSHTLEQGLAAEAAWVKENLSLLQAAVKANVD